MLIDFDALDRRIAANLFMSLIKQRVPVLLEGTHSVSGKSEATNLSFLSVRFYNSNLHNDIFTHQQCSFLKQYFIALEYFS